MAMSELTGMEKDWLAAYVQTRVAPYRALCSEEMIETMRRLLTQSFSTHPDLVSMVRRLTPPRIIAKTDDVLRNAPATHDDNKIIGVHATPEAGRRK